MAEIAIAVALAVVEGVTVHLAKKKKDEIVVPVDLEEAKIWLGKMQEILSDSEKMIDAGSPNLPCYYVKQVQDVAYEIEDALDEFMFDVLQHENSHALSKKLKKNKARCKLSSKMNDITKKKINAQIFQDAHVQPTPSSSGCCGDRIWSNQDLAEGDELVGFEALEEQLFTELKQTDQSRSVILIAGPAGSGKSTLANKVYRSPEVEGGASCVLDWVELPKISKEEAKKRCLQGSVQGQEKFLVVLDDAWIKQDLKFIVKALPNGRIIITSRNSGVASFLYPNPKYIDLSRGLSWVKAKELFCKKAFHDGQGNWPPELDEWAQKILKRCEGMPLAISAIGTFLFNKKIPVDWMTVHDSLGSELCTEGSDLLIISRNLQASYRDLPNHLRSCFLYFSMFPDKDEEKEEYYSISRERLIRLWAAEKFVEPAGQKPKEQVAEDYLSQLVERNLVVATAREFDGVRVRSCRVLNLVREINISRRKSFITVLEPEYYTHSGEKIRRLAAHKGGINLIRDFTSRVRTLLAFGFPHAVSDLEQLLKTTKFLRVLDLERTAGLKKFPKAVERLVLLTYLSLRKTDVERVPKSIKKNVILETLDLKGTKVTELPEEIKELKRLRYLLVNSYNVASHRFQGVKISKGVEDLSDSILKLSLIKVKNTEFIKALGKLKGLKKLGLVDLETEDGKEFCIALEQMKYLSTLDVSSKDGQSLNLDRHMQFPPLCLRHLYLRGSLPELPKWISELSSLQKVGLHGSNLNANPLEVLEALPHLIELNLVRYYGGEKLVFRADKFKTLMTLSIEQFDKLKSLEVEYGALPMLRELNMCTCSNLKSLPKGIGGLKSLYKLFLRHMPDELIAMLQKGSPHRHMVRHIPVIHSDKDGTGLQDLSENVSII